MKPHYFRPLETLSRNKLRKLLRLVSCNRAELELCALLSGSARDNELRSVGLCKSWPPTCLINGRINLIVGAEQCSAGSLKVQQISSPSRSSRAELCLPSGRRRIESLPANPADLFKATGGRQPETRQQSSAPHPRSLITTMLG